MEALHPRIRLLWIARGALGAIVLGIVLAAADQWLVAVPIGAIATLVGLGVVLGAVYAIRLYQVWQFELQADALYLERGVVTFHVEAFAVNRDDELVCEFDRTALSLKQPA